MNFGKAKNVLIFLFLAINIFLAYYYLTLSDTSIKVDEDSLAATVDILQKKGVVLDPAVVPEKTEKTYILELYNPFQDEQSSLYQHLSQNGLLTFSGQSFLYLPASLPIQTPKNLESRRAANKVLDALGKEGFLTSDLKWAGTTALDGGGYLFQFEKYHGGRLFFNTSLSVTLKDGLIQRIEGVYYEVAGIKEAGSDLKSPLNILISYSTLPEKREGKITNMELGYYVTDEGYKNLPALPSWRIVMEDGAVFHFDALTSTLLNGPSS